MKIAISNLAWDKNEDKDVLKLLKKYQIKGIELAPTKIWPIPTEASRRSLLRYKNFWSKNGISIVATTSLLFGHPELTIFENQQTVSHFARNKNKKKKTLKYLKEMIRVSGILGAKAMVFGSPKNRQTFKLPKDEIAKIAQEFFYQIGEYAQKYNLYFGIEPNAKGYGTDFINTTNQGINLVKKVNHPNFRLHLDTSTMAMNNEDYEKVISKGLPLACHFHISEPFLKPVPNDQTDHRLAAKILRKLKYDKWVSIEMPLGEGVNHLLLVEKALKFVTNIYG